MARPAFSPTQWHSPELIKNCDYHFCLVLEMHQIGRSYLTLGLCRFSSTLVDELLARQISASHYKMLNARDNLAHIFYALMFKVLLF